LVAVNNLKSKNTEKLALFSFMNSIGTGKSKSIDAGKGSFGKLNKFLWSIAYLVGFTVIVT